MCRSAVPAAQHVEEHPDGSAMVGSLVAVIGRSERPPGSPLWRSRGAYPCFGCEAVITYTDPLADLVPGTDPLLVALPSSPNSGGRSYLYRVPRQWERSGREDVWTWV